jgi:hypothetical protein
MVMTLGGSQLDPPRTEPALYRVLLLGCDFWLVADDEIALDYCQLAPGFECHLKTVAGRTRHRFRASARQHRTVDRDWLPPT